MEKEVRQLEEEFRKDCRKANSAQEVLSLKIKYLGRKSRLAGLFSRLPSFEKEERSLWGRELNFLKERLTHLLEEKLKTKDAGEERLDLTYPSSPVKKGGIHIINQVSRKICSIFEKAGFTVVEGPEVEDEWHNFTALNIPLEHPSRDVFDTFYLAFDSRHRDKEKKRGRYLLRSHTSPSQIKVMKKNKPPLAVISPGKVYRPDQVDAAHSFMFHQIEGFAVGQNISFAHLKGVLLYFSHAFFSPGVKLRFRPHFFPFTEPSAEVDISCIICKNPKPKTQRPATNGLTGSPFLEPSRAESRGYNSKKCSVCKGKGWLEVLGCGMIHPNVLKTCGINPKKYRGFAFGMGIDRLTMLKYRIDDIRLFYENDVRFLEQFF